MSPFSFNGQWIDASALTISPVDAGFVLGATVSDQLRTFAGRIFRLEEHLARLEESLKIIGVDPGMTSDQLAQVARELAARNHRLLSPGDDLGLSIFITPGPYPSYASAGPTRPTRPTIGLHTHPLPFLLWADAYRSGQALVTTDVRQVPACCWPPGLKCRSRMHYYLADQQAAAIEPGARALLLDQEGFVTETSTANVIIFRSEEGLIAPPAQKALHGISQGVVFELAAQLGIPTSRRDLTPAEVAAADEVLLSSTPPCLLPVTRLDGRPIADGKPGAVFRRLLAGWSELVGLDIVAQAERFAARA